MSAGFTPVTLVQTCPPHQWAHAPTVGYFSCVNCRKQVSYNEPEYATITAERNQEGSKGTWEAVGDDVPCSKCNVARRIQFREATSSCGGYADLEYRCNACGSHWYYEWDDA